MIWKLLAGAALLACGAGDIPVKEGEKIAFLGDSITQGGMGPTGYVSLVIQGLKANGIGATAIGAGISGHKSNDMLARVQRDVIDKKPDWMTLSCGVNDVWHGAKGVPLDQYKANIAQIVEKVQGAGIRVMILTSTMIGENPKEANNDKLIPYNEFLRDLAKEKKCLFADLNGAMQKELEEKEKAGAKRGNLLTSDGVHMNPFGNIMMASGVLRGFGLDEAQMSKAREAWLDIPGGVTLAPPGAPDAPAVPGAGGGRPEGGEDGPGPAPGRPGPGGGRDAQEIGPAPALPGRVPQAPASETRARKRFCCRRSSCIRSGCHWTPTMKRWASLSTPSMIPSSLTAVIRSPRPGRLIDWWCQEFTVGRDVPRSSWSRLPRKIPTGWVAPSECRSTSGRS